MPTLGSARDYHVSPNGDNSAPGSKAAPLRTIQEAANRAMPGDAIIVAAGTYRERVDPPRGGTSEQTRITYQAEEGATVILKGSEVVKGWQRIGNDTWKVVLPNSFFGDFNPYADEIRGDWFKPKGRKHHTGAVYLHGHWLAESATLEQVLAPVEGQPVWFASVEAGTTTIYAQLPDANPNHDGIEINVRQTVFYPRQTGRNFITVRGFVLEQASTNWAPPTAEQVGLIGTHWSKGWIIERNTIRYSVCSGVSLGKHGDKYDNTSANTATGYVATIKRGLAAGWSKETIGHHLVRWNHISHCEQAGIVGSLGAVFSRIEGNHIHDIHVRRLFDGAEQAAIKLHAAIDTVILDNHIHHSSRGIWLDWMAQGTRVTRNLVHHISPREDLYLEVNHGPFLVDHNLLLSAYSLSDMSQGGAYAHNLFTGKVTATPQLDRETPWHPPHATEIAGLSNIKGGDNRFLNNIFIGPAGLNSYNVSAAPNRMSGNIFLKGAMPSRDEIDPLVRDDFDPEVRLREENDLWFLDWNVGWSAFGHLVTSEALGKTAVSRLPFVSPDGSPFRLDQDYAGAARPAGAPSIGPFQVEGPGRQSIQLWQRNSESLSMRSGRLGTSGFEDANSAD